MADSIVSIINSALIKIGEDTIASESEDRKAARVSSRQYPLRKRLMLRKNRWHFSIKRASLAADGTAPAFGFENRFALPALCIRPIGVFDPNEPQVNYTSSTTPWVVEGRFILADGDEFQLTYVEDISDTREFDPAFDEALAWDLAADIAFDLSTGVKMRAEAARSAKDALRDAKIANAMESWPEVIQVSEWVDARGGLPRTRIGPVAF